MILLRLFWAFLRIGLFSVGGGYAALPLITEQTVTLNGWLTMSELTDLFTAAEMTPGPIAINAATFVGIRLAGVPGAVIATFGCIFPSLLIVTALASLYKKYRGLPLLRGVLGSLRPAAAARVAAAGLSILSSSVSGASGIRYFDLALFAAAFLTLRIRKASPILTMFACGLVCLGGGLAFGI